MSFNIDNKGLYYSNTASWQEECRNTKYGIIHNKCKETEGKICTSIPTVYLFICNFGLQPLNAQSPQPLWRE